MSYTFHGSTVEVDQPGDWCTACQEGLLTAEDCAATDPSIKALCARTDQDALRDRLTRDALADVDAGRIVEHHAVLDWAEKLDKE